MKQKILLISCIVLFAGYLFTFNACKSKPDRSQDKDTTGMDADEPENMAFCLWKEVSVRETPDAKGKWITSVYMAEKFEFLKETVVDSSDKKLPAYLKIKLKDGKEGWIQSTFVALKAKPAAIVENTPLYKRPDIMTKSDKEFSKMDIVAVIGNQDDWLEVKGKRRDGTWFDQGWIKDDKVTYDRDDVGVAVFALRAFEQKDEAKMKEELEAILENPDLEQSIFISEIYNLFNDASMERLEFDFSHFPSGQASLLMNYFSFEEVNIKEGFATINAENMNGLIDEVVRSMTSNYDIHEFGQGLCRIKMNYYTTVYLLLPDFLPEDERANGYYAWYDDEASSESKMFAFLIYKLDRSPATIKRLYDTYRDYALGLVDPDTYHNTNISETVNALIETYQHITKISDYKYVLKNIYQEVEKNYQTNKSNGDNAYGIYPIGDQYDVYQPILNENASYPIDPMWLHSFWVRRYVEGNMEIVYKILTDIKDYFSK